MVMHIVPQKSFFSQIMSIFGADTSISLQDVRNFAKKFNAHYGYEFISPHDIGTWTLDALGRFFLENIHVMGVGRKLVLQTLEAQLRKAINYYDLWTKRPSDGKIFYKMLNQAAKVLYAVCPDIKEVREVDSQVEKYRKLVCREKIMKKEEEEKERLREEEDKKRLREEEEEERIKRLKEETDRQVEYLKNMSRKLERKRKRSEASKYPLFDDGDSSSSSEGDNIRNNNNDEINKSNNDESSDNINDNDNNNDNNDNTNDNNNDNGAEEEKKSEDNGEGKGVNEEENHNDDDLTRNNTNGNQMGGGESAYVFRKYKKQKVGRAKHEKKGRSSKGKKHAK